MPPFLQKDIKELIWRMMTVDPAKRIGVQEIKEHPWFRSNNSEILNLQIIPPEEVVSVPDWVAPTVSRNSK